MPEEARRRIETTHDTNFVVIAGAGTGKTTLLIRKILALLRDGRAELNALAAITFTEKAAAEISVRLKEELDRLLAAGRDPIADRPLAPDELRRLIRARDQLGGAAITTLHGFAGRILRERPVEAHLPPDHHVQPPVDALLLFEELFDQWEERQLSEERPAWQRLLEQGITHDLRELARAFAGNMDTLEDRRLTAPLIPRAMGERFREQIEVPLARIRGALPSALDPEDPAARQATEQLRWLGVLADELLEDIPELLKLVRKVPMNRSNKGAKGRWASQAALEEIRLATGELTDARNALEAGWQDILAWDAYNVLRDFLGEYQREKVARGLVNFDDLLRYARNLLRDRPDVRAYFQDKYRMLLVDEFQDTDPLQAEILFFLAEDGAMAKTWREAQLLPGRLFIVGDPKQSIYRFRRADVEVFDEVRRLIVEQGGREETLERNFRSLPGVVHFVNAFFGQQIREPEDGGHYQPRYDPLSPTRQSASKPARPPSAGAQVAGPSSACVELLVHEKTAPDRSGLPKPEGKGRGRSSEEKGFSAGEARAVEALLIAERIRQMIDREALVVDREKAAQAGAPQLRPVRPGDIAILFRAVTHLDLYTDALRDRDIPFRVVGSKRFYAAPEIVDLTNVLRAVAAPHDTLALVGALRSPAFGLSDPEVTALVRARVLDYRRDPKGLLRLGRVEASEDPPPPAGEVAAKLPEGGEKNAYPPAESAQLSDRSEKNAPPTPESPPPPRPWGAPEGVDLTALDARVREAYKVLRELHALRDRISMPALVGEAMTRTSLWATAYASFGGEQKALNLEKVRGLARTYEAAGMRNLMRFTDLLLEAIRGEQEEEESSPVEETDDVVRILTIHKAKGLEWPVVFLPGLSASKEPGHAIFLEDREHGEFGFGLKDTRTANFAGLKERELPRAEAELIRLFYVASTRARDYLLLSGIHFEREQDSTLQRLEAFLESVAGQRWRALEVVEIGGFAVDPRIRALERAGIRMGDVAGLLRISAEMSLSRQSLVDLVERCELEEVLERCPEVEASIEAAKARRETLIGAPPAVTWLLPSKLEPQADPPEDETRDELRRRIEQEQRARLLGTLTHRAIELLDFRAPQETRELVDRAARLMAWEKTPVPLGMRDEAQQMVARFLESPLAERIRRGLELGRELPILYRPKPGIAVDGKIDLLFQDEDGAVVVVDYKTDDVLQAAEETVAETHLTQLGLYMLAVKEATGVTPGRVVVHFLKTGVSVEYDVDSALLDRAHDRLFERLKELRV